MPASTIHRNSAAGTATIKRLLPGAPGTKRLVEERPEKPEKTAWIRVAYGETELRQQVKEAGGEWHPEHKLWRLPLKAVRKMKLEMRVVADV